MRRRRAADDTFRVRLARTIAGAIADASASGEDDRSRIIASDALDALIANMAMILAGSPTVATPEALQRYCDGMAQRLAGETMDIQRMASGGELTLPSRDIMPGKH